MLSPVISNARPSMTSRSNPVGDLRALAPRLHRCEQDSNSIVAVPTTYLPGMEKIKMFLRALGCGFLMTFGVLGCAGNVAGARPSDMSQQQHESAAAAHSIEATDCTEDLGSCWGSKSNEEHKKQADEHRRVAAAHSAAGRALSDAEKRACQGVSEADRDISPFLHRESIAEVRPLTRATAAPSGEAYGEGETQVPAGATIVLLPAAGVTAERLERIVQCHIARNAALGNNLKDMPLCPLVPKGVTATATSTGNGFAVNISSDDQGTAAEILRRARALHPG